MLPVPSNGNNTITVSGDVFALLTVVMDEYDCESIADAVSTASVVAPDYSEAELAQLLADRLRE
jgi:hypothetical protein